MNVALGTGGAPNCDNLDLFEVMRAVALSNRGENGESKLPAQAVLMMATVCGARAQGRADTTGMIKEGMDADLILVDFTAPHLMPCHNVLSGLVYSAKGGDVAMTMVQGKTLYASGKFPTIDLAAVVEELTDYAIPKLFTEPDSEKERDNG
jgi:5-methylthioadenosine/S-adenosylhomocysteine deaminase